MAPIGPIITIIGSIILALLHMWQQGQPARVQEDQNEETQAERKAFNDGDAAVTAPILDGLLSEVDQAGSACGNAGSASSFPPGADPGTLAGLADLGIRVE